MHKLKVTLVQSILHWENVTENLKMFERKFEHLDLKHHLVVLPEMFTTGFTMLPNHLAESMQGTTLQWLQQMAVKHQATFCGSVIIKEADKYYNRLLWVNASEPIQYYNKRHLFAYAGEHEQYTSGNQKLILEHNDLKISCNVCYDLRFPVWVRQTKNIYDVLIYVANWPSKRIAHWQALLKARAIENQCYVVAVNRVGQDGNGHTYNGMSCIINPLGEVVHEVENEESIFSYEINKAEIEKIRIQFPFLQDKDNFELI